jgi:hypothetical protein
MTPSGLPDSRILVAWHQRFPDRLHLWAGHIRLWTVELALQAQSTNRPLAEWVAKAAALGLSSTANVARKLGLPEAAVRSAQRPVRRTFAFLELPTGTQMVPPAPRETSSTPVSISAADVPPNVLRTTRVDVLPLADDWRTVPFVRAVMLAVVVVRRGDGIEVYAAERDWTIGPEPTWRLNADAILPEARATNETELSPGEQWQWLGEGSLREAVLLRAQ